MIAWFWGLTWTTMGWTSVDPEGTMKKEGKLVEEKQTGKGGVMVDALVCHVC